ncbi:MAG: hypothetical protein SOV74_07310 [Coriobacteriales bacterium]|nr:hypothetical protein [Coriobacteriales bacterium]
MAEQFPGRSPEAEFVDGAARLARDQVARRANQTAIHNVGRDRDKGARFARVPMGNHTCAFCIMLASRGFVYHSEKTAGEFDHFHSDCRCKVVAGFPEMEYYVRNGVKVSRGRDPKVEGYDPDRYFDMYQHPEKYTSESEAHDYVRQSQHGQLRSNGDPAKEYYGPITDEQRNNFESECRRLGVEIMDVGSEELEDIAYGPRVGDYPPQIRIPRDASYLAHMHELDHAKADAENGQLTMIYYLLHPEVRIDMEKRAYGIEIERARADGYSELAERLEGNLAKEIENIESGSR